MMKSRNHKNDNREYDYLIVGAGLYGSTFARIAADAGRKVLLIERRNHLGGNAYTEEIEGIQVHRYGAHIFHTSDEEVWSFVGRFADFNDFVNKPLANYKGTLYSLPFNMHTFREMWGITDPGEAAAIIEEQRKLAGIKEAENLEERAISMVGTDIYEKLIKGYTQKQWGRECRELPPSIIERIPLRFTYDNSYFDDVHQGVPIGGYTAMIERMLDHGNVEVVLGVDYLQDRQKWDDKARKTVYTGPIDAFYEYRFGSLEYRTLRFESEVLNMPDFQGNAVVNYTDSETPWTRIIEHKWFVFGKDSSGNELPKTVITREYSAEWECGDEPYYPVNDISNSNLYGKYKAVADKEERVIFGGRLGEYKYYDMDEVIAAAMERSSAELYDDEKSKQN